MGKLSPRESVATSEHYGSDAHYDRPVLSMYTTGSAERCETQARRIDQQYCHQFDTCTDLKFFCISKRLPSQRERIYYPWAVNSSRRNCLLENKSWEVWLYEEWWTERRQVLVATDRKKNSLIDHVNIFDTSITFADKILILQINLMSILYRRVYPIKVVHFFIDSEFKPDVLESGKENLFARVLHVGTIGLWKKNTKWEDGGDEWNLKRWGYKERRKRVL